MIIFPAESSFWRQPIWRIFFLIRLTELTSASKPVNHAKIEILEHNLLRSSVGAAAAAITGAAMSIEEWDRTRDPGTGGT